MTDKLREAALAARDLMQEELCGLLSVQESNVEEVQFIDELVARYFKIIADLNAGLRATSAVVVAFRQEHPGVEAEYNPRQPPAFEQAEPVCGGPSRCPYCRDRAE